MNKVDYNVFDFIFHPTFKGFEENVFPYDIRYKGIYLKNKTGEGMRRFMDTIISKSYSPCFLTKKTNISNFKMVYVDKNYDSGANDTSNENAFWLLTLFQIYNPKYRIVVPDIRGEELRTVNRVMDIADMMRYHLSPAAKEYWNTDENDVYIRIKGPGTKILIYGIYKDKWSEVKEYLTAFRVQYKMLNIDDYI